MSASEKPPVQEGDVLAGKYRIERVLGVGGMGVVVAATHLQLEQKVAIKFLLETALENQESVRRFLREAKAAVRLKSQHVAKVIDVGTLENGAPYMVMEFLEGSDLGHRARETGALPVEQAVGFVLQACEAVAEAHSLGIVHRDLKPANLFVTRSVGGAPLIKVLDFGISKTIDTSEMSLTRTTSVMGSPLYMSPEQMRSSKNVDVRSDIWSIGVILYELLTGAVPFEADAVPELCLKVVQDPAVPPVERRADVPEALSQAVLRCLEKSPAARFQNVAELAAALEPFAPPDMRGAAERIASVLKVAAPHSIPPSPPPPEASGSVKAKTGTSWGQDQFGAAQPKRSRAGLVAGAGALAIVALVGLAMVAFRRHAASAGSGPIAPPSATEASPSTATEATAPPAPTLGALPSAATVPSASANRFAPSLPTQAAGSAKPTPTAPRPTGTSAPAASGKDAGMSITAPPKGFND
jgi:serine/threonine-protein kinase